MTTEFNERARRLRNAVEPVAAGVYFAPEAHAAYEALGFDASPEAAQRDGIARPEMKSYFTSRGACLGQVSGEVVAAAFGCFNPKVVVPGVAAGWQTTEREAILGAREQGATAMLQRVLGDEPEGMDRVTDLLREHRGDSHVISWAVGDVDAVEVLLLTEQYWGVPARAYAPSRGWTDEDMDAGFDRLQKRGLMTADEQITDAGRAFREEIEVRTDELERPLLDVLGGDLDELLNHLDEWSEAIIRAGSYPKRIAGVYNVGGGPHFGSGLTIDTAAELFGGKA